MNPEFICNKELFDSQLRFLKETKELETETDRFFTHVETGETWILTSYESEYLDCDIAVLMKASIDTASLIHIAITSDDLPTTAAAALELEYREKNREENFRHQLIEQLEQLDYSNMSELDKKRVRTIIYDSNLYDGTNQKAIMKKHWAEIQRDANFYQIPANKAKAILKILE